MSIREATEADQPRIRAVADQSFQFSYALSPLEIETILDGVFAAEPFAERVDDPETLFLVAERDVDGEERLAGFVDVDLAASTVRWLHVNPDARDQGVGTELFDRAREAANERGERLRARVLQKASEGGEFCTRFGFSRVGSDELAFGEERFVEDVYAEDGGDSAAAAAEDSTDESSESGQPDEPTIDVPDQVSVDGESLTVEQETVVPGTDAPFFPLFREDSADQRYGFLCSNCGSTDVSADGLDRLECGECGNLHLADEWDDAYL